MTVGPGPLAMIQPSRSRDESPARLAILTSTENLLAEFPLQALTASRILADAGVSRPTFYAHFPSKYAVVAELLDDVVRTIEDGLLRWYDDADRGAVATLRRVFADIGGIWFDRRHVMRSVLEHSSSSEEILQIWSAARARFNAGLAALIDDERAAGRAPAGLPSSLVAASLVASGERMWFVASLGLDPQLPTLDAAIDAIVNLAHGAIYHRG